MCIQTHMCMYAMDHYISIKSKEVLTDACYNMDESWKYLLSGKGQSHIWYNSIYMK